MTTAVTSGVQVSVETFYRPDQSNAQLGQHVFAYRITIENKSESSIQLRRRHWHIIDSNGEKKEVEGEGVIGQQPVIASGGTYKYVSGCNLDSEMGKMYGTYQMEKLDAHETFQVTIPEFLMVVPYKMN